MNEEEYFEYLKSYCLTKQRIDIIRNLYEDEINKLQNRIKELKSLLNGVVIKRGLHDQSVIFSVDFNISKQLMNEAINGQIEKELIIKFGQDYIKDLLLEYFYFNKEILK